MNRQKKEFDNEVVSHYLTRVIDPSLPCLITRNGWITISYGWPVTITAKTCHFKFFLTDSETSHHLTPEYFTWHEDVCLWIADTNKNCIMSQFNSKDTYVILAGLFIEPLANIILDFLDYFLPVNVSQIRSDWNFIFTSSTLIYSWSPLWNMRDLHTKEINIIYYDWLRLQSWFAKFQRNYDQKGKSLVLAKSTNLYIPTWVYPKPLPIQYPR